MLATRCTMPMGRAGKHRSLALKYMLSTHDTNPQSEHLDYHGSVDSGGEAAVFWATASTLWRAQ